MNANNAVGTILLVSTLILAVMFGVVGYLVVTTPEPSTQGTAPAAQESAPIKTLVRGTPEYCKAFSEDEQCQAPKPPKSEAQREKEWKEAQLAEKESQEAARVAQEDARIAFATRHQHELWMSGYECTFEARGAKHTTLYLESVLVVGKSSAYQMQKILIEPYLSKFREMGFKKIVLSDGYAHEYEWTL